MELKTLSPEFEELRNILISANLTTCYMILDEFATTRGGALYYEKFKKEWIGVYKEVYKKISYMKPRKLSR